MKANAVGSFFKKYTMILALVAVAIFFTITTQGKILFSQNINNLISQNGYVFVLAAGMLCCILTGGNIDLSVGSVVCFTGAIGAVIMQGGANMWVAVLVMFLVGLLIGAFQGFWIAWIHVPPFIATLAGMYTFRGLSNVILQGYAVEIANKDFLKVFGGGADCYVPDFIGKGEGLNLTCLVAAIAVAVIFVLLTLRKLSIQKKMGILQSTTMDLVRTAVICVLVVWIGYKLASYKGIPTVLIWIALVLLIYNYVTNRTAIGRHLYAVGGNEKATRLSGVNTRLVYFIAYANMGLLASLAGILTVARATSAQPTYGQGYEMDAIASCFIGGASAYGGTGKISGVIIGAILMGLINQGMSIMGIEANYQRVVKGIVLLLAVMFDVLSKREKR
ncbi:MAG: sugar ABC transporter permease [Clostridia bacterium]|nr:sugar ABC transporter permease [Clostridia bacterium]